MAAKKNILAIVGSASDNSSNEKLLKILAQLADGQLEFHIYNQLKSLPHFNPEQSAGDPPEAIRSFRNLIEQADGVVICTPEYVFSIPGGLKNALEWCVATTIFTDKPLGLITASAQGEKGHEELQLIMRTLMARLSPGATLLIQGVKGKISEDGRLSHLPTEENLKSFLTAFQRLVER